MSVTITKTISASGTQLTKSKTLTPSDEGLIIGSIAVSTGSTDKVWSIGGIDVSQVVAVQFQSDQAVTLETNATDAAGGNTITLAANVPYQWCTGNPDTLALTADVASTIYVTNASGTAATVEAIIVQDGTP